MQTNTRILLNKLHYGRGFSIDLVTVDRESEISGVAVAPITFKAIGPNDMITHENGPLATISRESAQHLLDELWFLGFRPEHGDTSNSTVSVMRAHLNDMRTIAFSPTIHQQAMSKNPRMLPASDKVNPTQRKSLGLGQYRRRTRHPNEALPITFRESKLPGMKFPTMTPARTGANDFLNVKRTGVFC